MFLTVQLSALLCFCFFVWILGWLYPLADWQGNLRLVLLLLLLAILTRQAWQGKITGSSTGSDSCDLQTENEVPPITSRQRMFQRAWQIVFHPLTISLLIMALMLIRVWPWRDILYNDEAIWKYVAYSWVHFDLAPYAGTFENKTPGIFYLFSLAELLAHGSSWFPRLAGIAAIILTAYGLYRIGRLIFNEQAGRLAMLLFGLTMLSPMVGGQWPALTETFMICAVMWCVFLLLQSSTANSLRHYLLALLGLGACLGVAIAFKQTAIFSLIGVLALYFNYPSHFRSGIQTFLRDAGCVLAGLLASTGLSLIPLLFSKVAFADYLQGAWWILLQPGSSAPSLSFRIMNALANLDQADLQLYLPLFLIILLCWKKIILRGVPLVGLLVWLLAEILAANASGTYFHHQLRQFMPPLALLGGVALAALLSARLAGLVLQPVHQLLGFLLLLFLWWPAYSLQLDDRYNDYTRYLPQTGHWLRAHTSPDDSLYIFSRGDGSSILAYAQRRSSSRFFTQYFLGAPGLEAELRSDLSNKPPVYLLLPTDGMMSNLPRRKVPEWVTKIVQDKYQLVRTSTYQLYMFNEWEERGYEFYRRK